MATYDVHQHLWPEAFVAVLRSRSAPPHLENGEIVTVEGRFPVDLSAHDPDARIRALDRDEVDVAVLSLQASLGLERLDAAERDELEELWANETRSLAAESGRFLALSPSRPRDGFSGICIGASTLLDPDGAAPVLDEASRLEIPVFVHPEAESSARAGLPSWWTWVAGYPAQMQAAYLAWIGVGRQRWPQLRIVFALLAGGAPFQLERLAHRGVDVRSALDPNAFFDVATYGRRAIELLIETFGVHQLVYGSDTPVVEPEQTLAAVRGFGESVAHVLQSDTPSGLLR